MPEELPMDAPSLLATLEDGDLAAVSVPAPQPQRQKNRPSRQNRNQNRQEHREKSANAREDAPERTLQPEGKKTERNPKSGNRNYNRPKQKQNRNNPKFRDNAPAQQPIAQTSAPEIASAPAAPVAPAETSAPQKNHFNRGRNRRGGYYRSGFRNGKKPEGGDKGAPSGK